MSRGRNLSLLGCLLLCLGVVLPPLGLAQARGTRAAPGLFKQPVGIALDAKGNIWVLDSSLARVTELSPAGKVLTHWGKTGTKHGQLSNPNGIAIDRDGSIWISTQTDTPSVESFTPSGKFLTYRDHTKGIQGGASLEGLGGSLAFDGAGDLWIALGGGVEDIPDVVELAPSGKEIRQWQLPHKKTTTKDGIAIDPRGYVYLTAESTNLIYKYTLKGKFLGYVAKHGSKLGQVDTPEGLAVDGQGNVYVADQGNGRVEGFTGTGKAFRALGNFFSTQLPVAVAVNRQGTVYMLDTTGVRVYTAKGKQVAHWS